LSKSVEERPARPFYMKLLLMFKNPWEVFEELSDAPDLNGLIINIIVLSLLYGLIHYAAVSKIMACFVPILRKSWDYVSRTLTVSFVIPMTLFDLMLCLGAFSLAVAIAYSFNRWIFKKETSFSVLFSAVGYTLTYLVFIAFLALIMVAIFVPPISNVSLYWGMPGDVLFALLRDYYTTEPYRTLSKASQIMSQVAYIVSLAIFLLSLKKVQKNEYREIIAIAIPSIAIFYLLFIHL